MPKRIALPVFSADAISSVAYAPEQIYLTLSIAGAGAYVASGWIGLAVAAVMIAVVASTRQNVVAYPNGGGDFQVAAVNHGPGAGLVAAGALLVDYILTVAVSISVAAATIGSAVPLVHDHKVFFSVAVIALIAAVNLRGVRESGRIFAIPTYAFMAGVGVMIVVGVLRAFVLGHDISAESAAFEIVSADPDMSGTAMVFLLLRAFASGCAALTGVEAIANGVPMFNRPQGRNAATTLTLLGVCSVALFIGMIVLADATGVQVVEDPATQFSGAPADYRQKTMLAQLAATVFSGFSPGFVFIIATTGLILIVAANTAFNGFPVLGSVLAQDRYLPRQLHTRGDRLAYSNGIVTLAIVAILLVIMFRADETRLIQLYIVGVFVAFVLSQTGMIRHWSRQLRTERDPRARRRMRNAQSINVIGAVMTSAVLVIVVLSKFTHGAWISVLVMVILVVLMRAIRGHYGEVAAELEPPPGRPPMPPRNHVVVLVSKIHKPTIRALSYAKATRPDSITALTVNVDDTESRALQTEWERRRITIPLTIVDSPYREITGPIVEYVTTLKRSEPRDLVTVFIPEYVVGHWWENLLHNQSALRIKSRLRFERGVMITSVPWQLESSESFDVDRWDDRLAGRQ